MAVGTYALVAEALLNGGHDNISVVVVDGGTRPTDGAEDLDGPASLPETRDALPRQRADAPPLQGETPVPAARPTRSGRHS